MRRQHRFIASKMASASGGSGGGSSSVSLVLPSSDVFERDLWHARRGYVGGHLSRAWFAFTWDGDLHVRSFQHNCPGADPTVHVPALAAASHRYVNLGAASVSAEDVVDAVIASLALDGITGVAGAVDPQGRMTLTINGASNLVIPAAVDTTDTSLRGMWGGQRDYWGEAPTQNSNGGTTGTGTTHLGNPNSQAGLSGRTGRIIGLYMWVHTNYRPRLAVSSGPAYSIDPGVMTILAQAELATATNGFDLVAVPGTQFADDAVLWIHNRENVGGGPRYRDFGNTPVGRGDIPVASAHLWDTTGPTGAGTAFGATYTPTVNNTFNIYIMCGVIYELQDEFGNYHADGSVDTFVGDQNTDPTHGTQILVDANDLNNETTHHRFRYPNWTNYGATEVQRVVTAIGPDEDSRVCLYGPWDDLNFPATTPPALLADVGRMGLDTPDAYNVHTFASRVEMGTEVVGVDPYISLGFNYAREGGLDNNTIELPIFIDGFTGDGSYLGCWTDDGRTWHDDIPGATGNANDGTARAPTSGISEYRTLGATGMPLGDPDTPWPDPFVVDPTDSSPAAIALDRLRLQRVGLAAA